MKVTLVAIEVVKSQLPWLQRMYTSVNELTIPFLSFRKMENNFRYLKKTDMSQKLCFGSWWKAIEDWIDKAEEAPVKSKLTKSITQATNIIPDLASIIAQYSRMTINYEGSGTSLREARFEIDDLKALAEVNGEKFCPSMVKKGY
jgi:hypothetical protein